MSAVQTTKMSNFRWVICALLFLATTINYMDRQDGKISLPRSSTGLMPIMVRLPVSSRFSMLWLTFLPESSSTGWAQRKVILLPSSYGRSVPCFMQAADGLP